MEGCTAVHKLRKQLSLNSDAPVYGRVAEKDAIREFLSGPTPILHITGVPGTGKTSTVVEVLRGEKYTYINSHEYSSIAQALKGQRSGIVVVDEFDTYFKAKRTECLGMMGRIGRDRKKLITISNNLQMGSLRFEPYSPAQLYEIVEEIMDKKVGRRLVDAAALAYLTKLHGKRGDLRALLKAIHQLLLTKDLQFSDDAGLENSNNTGKTGNRHAKVTCTKSECIHFITLKDCISVKTSENEGNFHQRALQMLAAAGADKQAVYCEYLAECERNKMPPLGREAAGAIFDMYSARIQQS